MTFKKSGNVSKALVIKEQDNDNDKDKIDKIDKRAINYKRLMPIMWDLRCGYGYGGCGGGGRGGGDSRLGRD